MQQFDDISVIEIIKRYHDYELQHLSKRKDEERSIDVVGRPFKLDVKNRFLMLLVYYRLLYITYTLDGFLFDLDEQQYLCIDI